MRRALRILFATAVAAGVFPATVRAQVVQVELRELESGRPVAGAVVRLLRDRAVVGQALTNTNGHAALRAPGAGKYRVRINRIGYRPVLSDEVDVKGGNPAIVELKMASATIVLPALETKATTQCGGRLDGNGLAGMIWEQVRTALTANVLTQRDRAVPVRIKEFRRDLAVDGAFVSEAIVSDAVVRGKPYAAPPAKTLIEEGFATIEDEEMTFRAPDADLFLSDEFAATHCFRSVPGTTDSIVGLAFEPAPGRKQPDVSGVLWMNRTTSELRYIEFAYENLPVELRNLGLGGRVEFERLSSGMWIINYWYIRMPRMAEAPQDYRSRIRSVTHLAGFVETGGRAEVAQSLNLLRVTIRGTAFDSTTMKPLAGASIRLDNGDSVLTNAHGQYVLMSAVGGVHTITASHPKLGLTADDSRRQLVLSLGHIVIANFGVPPARRIADQFCGQGGNRSGIIGRAFSTADSAAEGLELRAEWLNSAGIPGEDRTVSGPQGLYVFCELPANLQLRLRLMIENTPSAERTMSLDPGQFIWLDVRPP